MLNKTACLIASFCALFMWNCTAQNLELYVSPQGNDKSNGTLEMPLLTIEKALGLANEKRSDSDHKITINLKEGEYHLSKPLLITDGLSNVSIIGEGHDKVSIKGSKVLKTNWKIFKNNIWVTDVEDNLDFNQLMINGEKQILARYPNYNESGGYWQGYAEDVIAKNRVASWKNPVGGFLHVMHNGRWGGFHYEITGVDDAGDVILEGGHQNNRPNKMHPKYRMVENIFEELDSEKEWFYDKASKKLYLMSDRKDDLENAVVEVSTLKHLIDIKGTIEKPVKNIHIEGISFKHSMRTFMEEYEQLLRSDWTIYRGGAITLDGTENSTIKDCEFTELGGNVIFVNGYNRNVEVIGNHIYNCGASAVSFVGDASAVRSPSFQYNEFVDLKDMDTVRGPANKLFPAECLVENNLIYKIGRVEKQVAGVQISMAMDIHVKNNSIYDVPRAGINVSEGTWGGHLIEYNDVFNTVLETSDHGAFNSWGRDRFWHPNRGIIDKLVSDNPQMPYWDAIKTTTIRGNRFRCDHGWDIDLDDGSSNYHIYDNLCLNGGIKLREGFYRVVENNIMVNNGFHPHVWFANSGDVFRKNIMMTKHFPIRLKGWGKEVDYNLFPDSASLLLAQEKNTDLNSAYGNPLFKNPEESDFTVAEGSPALKMGFKNFPMDNFGVQKTSLKSIAAKPDIPELNIVTTKDDQSKKVEWLGGIIKNIETLAEQSASGLPSMEGVLVSNIKYTSKLYKTGISDGDVIIGAGNKKVNNISELISVYDKMKSEENITLKIFRHQKEMEVVLKK